MREGSIYAMTCRTGTARKVIFDAGWISCKGKCTFVSQKTSLDRSASAALLSYRVFIKSFDLQDTVRSYSIRQSRVTLTPAGSTGTLVLLTLGLFDLIDVESYPFLDLANRREGRSVCSEQFLESSK